MAFTTPPAAGTPLLASTLASLVTEMRPGFARKTVDETVNNSATLQDDDDLALAVVANAVYLMEVGLRVTSNTTADFKYKFTFPTGLTMKYNEIGIASGTANLFPYLLDETVTATAEGNVNSFAITLEGIVIVSSTAGTLRLQWAQNTANLSNTVVAAGSYMWLQRMA